MNTNISATIVKLKNGKIKIFSFDPVVENMIIKDLELNQHLGTYRYPNDQLFFNEEENFDFELFDFMH